MKTQGQVVLRYLETHKRGMSSMDAFKFGITRLADVIMHLRGKGHIIDTEMKEAKTKYGKTKYAQYHLVKKYEPKK